MIGLPNEFDPAIAAEFIGECEGFVNHVYKDSAGHLTIGYGHMDDTLDPNQKITESAAQILLANDLKKHAKHLNCIEVQINSNQYIALMSFVFNLGNVLPGHTLLRKLNAGDYDGAANEFPKWIYCDGKPNKGLLVRRNKEKALFLS